MYEAMESHVGAVAEWGLPYGPGAAWDSENFTCTKSDTLEIFIGRIRWDFDP